MLIYRSLLLFTSCLLLESCSISPEAIVYGKDNCALCKMTIMDKQFGTELVTKKGKVFKFDDMGCMMKYLQTTSTSANDYQHIVVNCINKPTTLTSYKDVFFVYSEQFRSPMLGNIGAFSSQSEAEAYVTQYTASQTMSWTALKEHFK